jgi:hypothetical protein
MQQAAVLDQAGSSRQVAMASKDDEPGLKVVTVYQDPLTRDWAAELWGRVEQLISDEQLCRQSWKISDLTDPRVFMDAVQAAAEADVLVVSVRDTRELPIGLYVWIDSWIPSRTGPAGALVALIGVPPEPDAQSGRAYEYLEGVARKARLDFLPHERKLSEQPSVLTNPGKLGHMAIRTTPAAAGAFKGSPRAHLHWGLL